ncbi:unnamed protein product [Kuraishia capsulata CBS 1993]|uniref:Uncharacterized protein n=1 Tax=Kuraishia capsulata CBS 1993 TaxID=1382522 RepID=W6MIT7_9ASCO|nr:uncharacterized protein KUCA_T00001824001 [Kuraishia capsulata CBS 1993]CDK25853.1 unnamed protein product [Kuraishia capsulata CBS 1993]
MAKEDTKPEQRRNLRHRWITPRNLHLAQLLTEPLATKPKPCCVCIPEKQSRDECFLINGTDSDKCKTILSDYKNCMKGFGFEVN